MTDDPPNNFSNKSTLYPPSYIAFICVSNISLLYYIFAGNCDTRVKLCLTLLVLLFTALLLDIILSNIKKGINNDDPPSYNEVMNDNDKVIDNDNPPSYNEAMNANNKIDNDDPPSYNEAIGNDFSPKTSVKVEEISNTISYCPSL